MELLALAKTIADRVEAAASRAVVPVSVCIIDTHGNVILKYASTSLAGAPLIEIRLFAAVPRNRGHPASATVSTPGTVRRRSATWFQRTGDCPPCATVSSVSRRSVENPVG